MLDADLAEIYGYSTKSFNQQVKNNIKRFAEDFRFQLKEAEIISLSRSKILTSMQTKGVKGGRSYKPFAFTEQGIYMLMTVLKGDLAVQQSKALIRLFKQMKDYIAAENAPDISAGTVAPGEGRFGQDFQRTARAHPPDRKPDASHMIDGITITKILLKIFLNGGCCYSSC